MFGTKNPTFRNGNQSDSSSNVTQVEEVAKKLSEKYKVPGNEGGKRLLYLSLFEPKRVPLGRQVLRLMRSDELLLKVHKELKLKKISHQFFALVNKYVKNEEEIKPKEFNDQFFKEGKWERVGELMKGSERVMDKNDPSKKVYSKKMFYLGKDILYYRSKEKTAEVNAISLQQSKISNVRDPRDNKPLIRIDTPSAQNLFLKAGSEADFFMWYNNLYYAAMNAHAKKKIDDFSRLIQKLEQEITRSDKRDIASYFQSADGMLQHSESRSILFEDLANYKEEYRYLEKLYTLIQQYKTMVRMDKPIDLVTLAKTIMMMLEHFGESEEEAKEQPEFEEDVRERMREEMANDFLKSDVQELMKCLISPEKLVKLKEILEMAESEGYTEAFRIGFKEDLFEEIEKNLLAKVKVVHNEMRLQKKSFSQSEIKLLFIPVSRFKKSVRWTAPCLPALLENPDFNSRSTLPAQSNNFARSASAMSVKSMTAMSSSRDVSNRFMYDV